MRRDTVKGGDLALRHQSFPVAITLVSDWSKTT